MSHTNKKKILIVTNSIDPHSTTVENLLSGRADIIRLNSDEFGNNFEISLRSSSHSLQLIYKNNELTPRDISSVWFRKPTHWKIDVHQKSQDSAVRDTFTRNETLSLINQYLYELESNNVFMVSRPSNIKLASIKLPQLKMASRLGFLVPNTLISSSKVEIVDFIQGNKNGVISKPIGKNEATFGKSNLYYSTTLVSQSDFNFVDDKYVHYPVLLQEQIHKQYEIRVTVVGHKVFACKIESQSLQKTIVDWKKVDAFKIPHMAINLPTDIKKMCILLTQRMGLEFSTIDLAVDKNNNYIFFELNPNGQYLWVEMLTGLPISEAIVSNLLNH